MRRRRPQSDAAATGPAAQLTVGVRERSTRSRWLRGISPALGCCAYGLLIAVQLGCTAKATAPTTGIATILVSPDSVSLSIGSAEALRAQAQTASSQPVSDQPFFWSTSDSTVASVTQAGVVVAHEPGAVQIGASAQGRSGFARVIVVNAAVHSVTLRPQIDTIYAGSPDNATTLTATAYDSAGRALPGRPVLWSTNTAIVTVVGGRVTGTNTGAGVATITATSPDSGFPAASAKVMVIGHVATVNLTPSFAWLSRNGDFFLPQTLLPDSVQLSATLTDTFGHDVSGNRPVSWSTADPTIATVSNAGLVIAATTTRASTTITAKTPDGTTGSAAITVFP